MIRGTPDTEATEGVRSGGLDEMRFRHLWVGLVIGSMLLLVFAYGSTATTNTQIVTGDPVGWTQLFPASSPSARFSFAMAYDVADGYIVIFGGNGGDAETWTFKGGQWTHLFPSTSPSARDENEYGMVYDAADGYVVLFGGIDQTCLGDTWKFNGGNWAPLSPAQSPSARVNAGIAYHAADGRVVLFAGSPCGGLLDDTWEFLGGSWTQVFPAVSPSTRSVAGAMTYDANLGAAVIFGGGASTGFLDGTWKFQSGSWTDLAFSPQPAARFLADLAFDPADGYDMLFGGATASLQAFGDTWSLITVTPAQAPVAGVSVTSPANGATLFTDFDLALSATPSSGKIVHGGTIVPMAVISPQSSLATGVQASYSNTGGAASGTLTLTDGGTTVGMLALTNFQGAASMTFGVTLGLGAHTLAATLSLSNSAGSSTASATVNIGVSSAISALASLGFTISGPATASYFGKLTFQVVSGGIVTAEGLLGASAPSFSSLALPASVSSGQSLLLQEPIGIMVTGRGTITVTASVTANGYSHSASVTFAGVL